MTRHPARSVWKGLKVLITAGPTREHLDPIRFLTNASSGRMGGALAEAAARRGAQVTVILGPIDLPINKRFPIKIVKVTTAEQMLRAVRARTPRTDVLIGAAAVGDWRFKKVSTAKIKRNGRGMTVTLVPNTDIIAEAANSRRRPRIVAGFALETGNLIANARLKLSKKNLDLVVANSPQALAVPKSKITLIDRRGAPRRLGLVTKQKAAVSILHSIERLLQ